ncbi:MAG: hypothetical protein ACXVPN_15415 [Bacteroidia bacterium]
MKKTKKTKSIIITALLGITMNTKADDNLFKYQSFERKTNNIAFECACGEKNTESKQQEPREGKHSAKEMKDGKCGEAKCGEKSTQSNHRDPNPPIEEPSYQKSNGPKKKPK